MTEANLDALGVVYLENSGIKPLDTVQGKGITLMPSSLQSGSRVGREMLSDIVRLNLREIIWCKLGASGVADSQFYLHFGWGFYMYIGSQAPSVKAVQYAESNGLFVESIASPYL